MATGPEHYREAEALLRKAHRFTYGDGADPVTGAALAAEAQAHATLALFPAAAAPTTDATKTPLTVYRAEHESIGMGLYTTAAEARKHCEDEERRSWSVGTNLSFDWLKDDEEEDSVAELVVTAGQNEESTTGYVVTPLEVASEYDAEADA